MSDDSHLQNLKARLLSGEISRDEAPELLALLQEREDLLDELCSSIAVERLLTLVVEPGEESDAFALEVVQRLKNEPKQDRFSQTVEKRLMARQGIPWRRLALPLAAAVTLLATLGWYVGRDNALARVRAVADVNWSAGKERVVGDKVAANGTVSIDAGLLELVLPRRGEVVLQGPAELTVRGRKQFHLASGSAVFSVTPGGRGLAVHTDHGTVVDLGTSFALDVTATATEVHVYVGSVEFEAHGNTHTLSAGDSMRSEAGSAAPIPSVARFVGKLPTPGDSKEPALFWPGPSAAPPLALKATAGGTPPEWTYLRSGPALSFTGAGAYAQSGFPGVAGDTHRTVALWVRIPSDWTTAEGGALIGWGRFEWQEEGGLFQLTLNQDPALGPVGAPQLDTFGPRVTADRDLRDGAWHHLAVTTYQSRVASERTHVLFYLDGRLLPSTPGSIPRIDTIVGGSRQGVVVGRSVQSLNTAEPGPDQFFRGAMDDLFLSPRALSGPQIRALMEGSPPRQP